MKSGLKLVGKFTMRCYSNPTTAWGWLKLSVFGIRNLKWEVETHNLITNEGLDHALNVILNVDTQIDPWYVLLFNTNTTPLATFTYATPVFTESANYDEVTRQAYVEAAASSQSITNSANRAVLTMNATETIYGAALVSDSTKDDQVAAGAILFCAALFSNAKSVNDDDTLEVTYTVGAADDGA